MSKLTGWDAPQKSGAGVLTKSGRCGDRSPKVLPWSRVSSIFAQAV